MSMRRGVRGPSLVAELGVVGGMRMARIDVLIAHAAILAVLVLHYHRHWEVGLFAPRGTRSVI